MRTTWVVLRPKDSGAFEVLAIAPRGLWRENVIQAVRVAFTEGSTVDISAVSIAPLTQVRQCKEWKQALNAYLENHQMPSPLLYIRHPWRRRQWEQQKMEQKVACDKFRSKISSTT